MMLLKKSPAGNRRGIDMMQGPILKNLLLFSVPMILSGVLQLLFSAADIAVAGRYISDAALAAIGATATLITVLVNLLVGLSVGVSVFMGRAIGAKDQKVIGRGVSTAMILAVCWGAVVSAISFFGAETLLMLMKVPTDILPLAVRYLRIYACGMIGSALFNFGSALLRATGDSKNPLFCIAVSCGLNFALNFLFVRKLDMGLNGVAWATAISLWVMGLLTLVCLLTHKSAVRLSLRKLRFCRKTLGQILGLGIPAGLQGIFFPLSNIVLQTYINDFGAVIIAANSAACNIESFVYQALNGFYHGCMAFVSCNMGAHNWSRVRKVFSQSLWSVMVTGLVLGLGMIALGRPLLGIYTDTEAIVDKGLDRFLFTGIPYFVCGMMEVVVGALRGMGSSLRPMIISVLGVCGVRIAWVLAAFQFAGMHQVETVYIAYPLSWVVTLVAQGFCLYKLMRSRKEHCL